MAALAAAAAPEVKELTADEIEDYREAFKNFDKDDSGEIDDQELATVLRSLGYAPTDKQLQDMMARVDLDGNGTINFEEFVAMMKSVELTTDFDLEIREAFKFFDKDGSGAIDPSELSEIMRGLGANLSEAEIDLLLKEADSNSDGSIDLSEFLKIMYS